MLICDSPERIDIAIAALEQSPLIANDVETHPYKRTQKSAHVHNFALTVCAFSCVGGDFVFPLQLAKSPLSGAPTHIAKIIKAIKHINALPIPQVGHNFTYDAQWYIRYGMPVRNWAFDTMVMFWAIWPDMPKSLGFVASILLDDHQYWKQGRKDDDWLEFLLYAGKDTWATFRICQYLLNILADPDESVEWYRVNFTHAMLRCYAATGMNTFGSKIDEDMLQEIEKELRADADSALERLRYLVADPQFNPSSPKQMQHLLYEVLGSKKRTAKGREVRGKAKPSTGQIVQRLIKQESPIHARIMSAIEAVTVPAKQISNIVNMPQFVTDTGNRRFLTTFNGVGTITTRFASTQSSFGHGSNAQNIRKKYRRFLRADPGYFTLEIDFSGADAVYVAFESEEDKLIEIFKTGRDLHAVNAALLFPQWTYERVVEGYQQKDSAVVHPIYGVRQIGKKVGHGANYLMAGMTLLMTATVPTIIAAARADGFADSHAWSLPQLADYCGVLDTRYRDGYPRLKRTGWYRDIARRIHKHHTIETIYRFTLPISGDPTDDATIRLGAATYGQASTAGRTNAALYELQFGIRTLAFRDGAAPDLHEPPLQVTPQEHGVRITRQTHDSLTFQGEADHPNLAEGLDRIFHVMRRPFVCKGHTFALGIEADISRNWAHNETSVRSTKEVLEWIRENREFLQ